MSQPEILRRCAVCGAAARPGAVFCPQCGNTTVATRSAPGSANSQGVQGGQELDPRLRTRRLDSADGLDSAEGDVMNSESAADYKQTFDTLKAALQETLAQKNAFLQLGQEDEANQLDGQIEAHQQALAAAAQNMMSATARSTEALPGAGEQVGSQTPFANVSDGTRRKSNSRNKANRATSGTVDAVEDSVQGQKGKLRQASGAVLEEATYDSSVRFVLIAAILFILSLVIMILSKVIT